MELRIFWTDFAKNELRSIFDYYKDKAGSNVAKKLVSDIAKETTKLKSHSEIGQKEELLRNNPKGVRYFLFKNYKIIYWVNLEKQTIEILDVFDTRQNPININRNK